MVWLELFAAVTLAASPAQSPEGRAFATALGRALLCSTDAAGNSSFDRDEIDTLPREILEQCSAELELATQRMQNAIPNSDPILARDNVAAKMRMAAQERLISRLEAGEYLRAANVSGFGLEKAGARYVSCLRLSINHHLEGAYVGQNWIAEMAKISDIQTEGYFIKIGRSSCSSSFKQYADTLNAAYQNSDRRVIEVIARNWNVENIENVAAKPYVRMAFDLRQKTP